MSKRAVDLKFQKAWETLNRNQREAVETLDGPVMVLAGPGTGKTQIIAMRIANILRKTDTPPNAILALTFTESGVQAMRNRLVDLVGTDGYYVQIYTFHAFCAEIIRSHPEKFLISPDPQPLSDLERYEIIQDILDVHQFESLKPINAPYYYVQTIIGSIQTLKREGVEPPAFKALVEKQQKDYEELLSLSSDKKNKITKLSLETARKAALKNQELLEIFYLYQKAVIDRGRFDFEDMINFVIQGFESDEELLTSFQEKSQYILIDEFQDTNSAQNTVARMLASFWGKNANIFVVGDPNQSIYRFQGANLENLLAFTNTYPDCKLIALVDNYRSTQNILDAASGVISQNPDQKHEVMKKIGQGLVSHSGSLNDKIGIAKLPSDIVEDYFIAQSIKKLLDTGVHYSEIAVLARKNADVNNLSQMLNRMHIPTRIQGGNNVLNDLHIRQFLSLLKVIRSIKEASEGIDLFICLNLPFFNFDSLDLLKLSRTAAKNNIGVVDVLESDKYLKSSEVNSPTELKAFLERLSGWEKLSHQVTVPEFLETLVSESGFLKYLENRPEGVVKLNRLRALLSLVCDWYQRNPDLTLDQTLEDLELMESHGINLSEPDLGESADAISLTTAHRAKGLEWNYVFLYRVVDGVWGNVASRELIKLPDGILKYQKPDTDKKEEQNADERRLFYVSLTRARKQVVITYASAYSTSNKTAVPSMFISEINEELKSEIDTKPVTRDIKEVLAELLTPPPVMESTSEQEFLRDLVTKEFRLSPTAFTSYLECGYRFKLQNLIKIPQAPNSSLYFGSAVHKTLELFYRVLQQEGTVLSVEVILEHFRKTLDHLPVPTGDKAIRQKQGEQVLRTYFEFHQGEFVAPVALEKWFGGINSPIIFEDASLVGKVDRMEYVDRAQNTIRIIDYKTGKPKTMGQIQGTTQDSDGSYKRQLLFYKLLTELDPLFPYKVVEVQLDFVEGPFLEKRFVKHTIEISQEDIEDLKKNIKDVLIDIRALKFDKTTDRKKCVNCPFYAHCWPEGLPPLTPEQLSLLNP